MAAFLLRLEAGTDFGCAMTSKLMDLVLRRLVKLDAPKVSRWQHALLVVYAVTCHGMANIFCYQKRFPDMRPL